MEKTKNSPEEKMMEALTLALYGRPSQNRCSIISSSKRELIKIAAMEMVGKKEIENAIRCPLENDTSSID